MPNSRKQTKQTDFFRLFSDSICFHCFLFADGTTLKSKNQLLLPIQGFFADEEFLPEMFSSLIS